MHGLFRIRPISDNPLFPEIGLYREDAESGDKGSDPLLLQQIGNFTGGRFNPSPESVFDSGGRRLYSTIQLWPISLASAILFSLAELVLRKWSGLRYLFRRG